MRLFRRFAKEHTALPTIIRWCLLALVVATPLIVYPMAPDAFELTKWLVFGIITGCVFLLWIIDTFVLYRREVHWTLVHTFISAFTVVAVAAALFSVSGIRSMIGPEGSVSGTVPSILMFSIFSFLLVQMFTTLRDLRILILVFLSGAGVALLFSFLQYWEVFLLPWAGARTESFTTLALSPLTTVIFFASTVILGLCIVFFSKKRWEKITIGSGVGLALLLLALYDKKIGWIALGVALFAVMILFAFRPKVLQSRRAVILMLCLAFSIGMLFIPVTRWTNKVIPDDTILHQGSGWNVMLSVMRQRPVLGTGPQTFLDAFQRFRPAEYNQSAQWQLRFIKSSNQWFEIATTMGILGFAAFLGILVTLVDPFLRRTLLAKKIDDVYLIALFSVGALMVMIFSSFILPWNFILNFLWWFFLAVALRGFMLIVPDRVRQWSPKSFPYHRVLGISAIIIAVAAYCSFIFFGVRIWNGERLRSRSNLSSVNTVADAQKELALLEKSSRWNPYSTFPQLLTAQASALTAGYEAANSKGSLSPDTETLIAKSRDLVNRAITRDPNNVLTYENAVIVYRALAPIVADAPRQITVLLEQAVERDSSNPAVYNDLGEAYLVEAQFASNGTIQPLIDKAKRALATASSLKPNFIDPLLYIALAEDLSGDTAAAEKRLISLHSQSPATTGITLTLADLYERHGEDDKAIPLYQDVITVAPGILSPYSKLEAIYEKKKEYAKALDVYQKLAVLRSGDASVQQKINELSKLIEAQKTPAKN